MKASVPLFLSQRLDFLVEALLFQLEKETGSKLGTRLLLVSNAYIRQWLLLEITKRRSVAMGVKILTLSEGIPYLLQKASIQSRIPNQVELFALIYPRLAQIQDAELIAYLEGKKERRIDLSRQLASLFCQYGQWGPSLLSPSSKAVGWQEALLQQIFQTQSWYLPAQILPTAKAAPIDSLHCFGIDSLPPLIWNYLFSHTSLSVYQFSPCMHFWEDIYSDRERRAISRFWKTKKTSLARQKDLDTYLRQAPSLLANWGQIGRDTLKELGNKEFQLEELYASFPGTPLSLLKRIQLDLLDYEVPSEPRSFDPADDSIQIACTGTSRLREIEVLRDRILELVQQKGVAFSEIAVLAPQLEPYVPLIEFLFKDPLNPLPFRIFGVDCSQQSSVCQGLMRLLQLGLGRWEKEELIALFETPSFYRKQGWDAQKVDRFRQWLLTAPVQWGLDEGHRRQCVQETMKEAKGAFSKGSWEMALDRWLQQILFLFPEEPLQKKERFTLDDFEDFLQLFQSLKTDLAPFRSQEETLLSWAQRLQQLIETYLLPDGTCEADQGFLQNIRSLLRDFRKANQALNQPLFPFAAVQPFLTQSQSGQIQGAHLHGIRIAPLEEGAGIPAKAIFLIGMDELQFPRPCIASSLNLLKKAKERIPEAEQIDRYLLLKTLFAATDYLRISYGHLSAEEGKEVGPSLLVQELLSYIDRTFHIDKGKVSSQLITVLPSLSFDSRCFDVHHPKLRSYSLGDYQTAKAFYGPKRTLELWPSLSRCPDLPSLDAQITLSLKDLTQFARHPWRYALQKNQGIFLEGSNNDSLALQKAKILRACLKQPFEKVLQEATEILPSGLFGEALKLEIEEKAEEWKECLQEWGVGEIFSLSLRENQTASTQNAHPPLVIELEEGCTVRLIGEIQQVCKQGLLCSSEDSVGGALRIWPEALVASILLQSKEILFLKSGKRREISNPEHCLKQFLRYYLRCSSSVSPFLCEWAEAFLRKGPQELEKKLEAALTGRFTYEDPIVKWVLSRTAPLDPYALYANWNEYLKEQFEGLIALYPTRVKGGSLAAL